MPLAPGGSVSQRPENRVIIPSFPLARPRRNRRDDWTRRLVAENRLSVDDLIWPIFIREGDGAPVEVASMPGQFRVGLDRIVEHVGQAVELGIPAVALFPACLLYTSPSPRDRG